MTLTVWSFVIDVVILNLFNITNQSWQVHHVAIKLSYQWFYRDITPDLSNWLIYKKHKEVMSIIIKECENKENKVDINLVKWHDFAVCDLQHINIKQRLTAK